MKMLCEIVKEFKQARELKDWDTVDELKQKVYSIGSALVVLNAKNNDGVDFKLRVTGWIHNQEFYDKNGNTVSDPSLETIYAGVTGGGLKYA